MLYGIDHWLLLYYFNNVHIYGPIRIKILWFWHVHIIHLLVFQLMSYYRYCLLRDIIPDIPDPDYTLAPYYCIRTVTVQLPMRVLHGIYML